LSTRPWSDLEYLKHRIGEQRVVPVEIGSKYTDAVWTQRIVSIKEFFEHNWGNSSGYVDDVKTNHNGNGEGSGEGMAYLAQHDLIAQVPKLMDDISTPDFCYVDTGSPNENDDDDSKYDEQQRKVIRNVWFGPAGTISPLHYDPYHNLLTQVVGSKYIRLYAPDQTERVYPYEEGSMLNNTSQVG